MMNHPATQQVTAQQQHVRTQNPHQMQRPQQPFNKAQFQTVQPQAQITHD